MSNKEFMNLLKEACKQGSVEKMDEYLQQRLCNVMPYDLVFKEERI